MPAAEDFSNFVQGGFGSLPGQIHSHLAREHDIRVASFAGHVREPNPKMFSHLLLNLVDCERLLDFFSQNISKKLFCCFPRTLSPVQ